MIMDGLNIQEKHTLNRRKKSGHTIVKISKGSYIGLSVCARAGGVKSQNQNFPQKMFELSPKGTTNF